MKPLDYPQIIKLAKTAIEEDSNWGMEEIVRDVKTEIITSKSKSDRKTEIIEEPKEQKTTSVKQTVNDNNKNTKDILDALKKEVLSCKKCPLGNSRLNAVFGVGDPYTNIMFIGEGPGFQEDHKGEPFVGRAGALLDKIIAAMGFSRQTVYIANIVKCHPMKNPSNPELKTNDRPPTQDEMQACKPYLDKQIEIIAPKVIVTLGSSSTKALLQTEETISSLRGKFKEYHGIKLMPTYHPAALLRNPNLKKDVWRDMQQVMAYLKNN